MRTLAGCSPRPGSIRRSRATKTAWARIVAYNEDDVRATVAVRRYLRSAAGIGN